MRKLQIMVVDEHPLFRVGVVHWIREEPNLTVCGEAGSTLEFHQVLAVSRPDVIVMELERKEADGFELLRLLKKERPEIRVLALSHLDETVYAHRVLKAGARGFLMKSAEKSEFVVAIHEIVKGDIYLSPHLVGGLLREVFPTGAGENQIECLSNREMEVFQLLGEGCNSDEIGRRLRIKPKTVDTYREHLKKKLRLPDGRALFRSATVWSESGQLKPRSTPRLYRNDGS